MTYQHQFSCINQLGVLKQTVSLDTKACLNDLKDILKYMILSNVLDKKCIALQRTGRLGTFAASTGQEAIFATAGYLLDDQDVYVPYYRDQAALLARGLAADKVMSYWGGDERGNDFSHQPQDMPYCVPIATQCPHAVGIAYALKYTQQNNVVLVTLGDGATSKGDFYESMNFSKIHNLPIIYLINNNQWAISVPINLQSGNQALSQKGLSAGIDGYSVDGNDILALYQCLKHAIKQAREHNQPQLIEAVTYRICDHTTADDASRYTCPETHTHATSLDPIKRAKLFLKQQDHWHDDEDLKHQENSQKIVQAAAEKYLNTETQPITSLYQYHGTQEDTTT